MAQKKVFLSYGRKDVYPKDATNPVEREQHFPIVEKVYRQLKSLGLVPWLDKYDLTTDREFTDSINLAIEACDFMLLFIGSHAMQSEWCAREWKHALKNCKPIIPILLEGDWGDELISKTYPSRVRNTDGINPQKADGSLDEAHLLEKIAQALRIEPKSLVTPYNARKLPAWYIEREQYLDALKKQLAVNDKDYSGTNIVGITSEQEVAALQGIGGIGKTTLALAICADCDVRRAFDQIFWLEFGPAVDKELVPKKMEVIGTIFSDDLNYYQDIDKARARLQFHLQGKRSLIVLDDVWQEGIVDAFSLAGVDCRLLVTTRNKSLVQDSQAVSKLNEEEGLRLLATVFDSKNPTIDKLDAGHRAIVRKLDGYTLALEIAGKWLMKYKKSSDYYLKQLESNEAKLFDNLQMSKTDKNVNLARSLALTYESLSEEEQTQFRSLGVIAPNSSFDETALAALWQLEDATLPLQVFLDLGLLDRGADGRYSQHGLLRAYALQLLREKGEYESSFHTYAAYVTKLAENFRDLPFERWKELDFDLPHIDYIGDELARQYRQIAAKESLSEGENRLMQLCADFAWNVQRYVNNRPQMLIRDGEPALRGMSWLEVGLVVYARQGNKSRQASTLNNIGLAWDNLGDRRKALDYYNQALPLQRELSNKSGEASTLNNIGSAWDALGDRRKALDFYNQALTLCREVGDKSGEATILNNIGRTWRVLGEVRKALDFYDQSLLLQRELDDKSSEATTLNNIGAVWRALGEVRKALDFYNQALLIDKELGKKAGEATALNNIGLAWSDLGDIHKALDFYNQALPILRDVGDKSGEAGTLINIGAAWSDLGDIHKALDFYNQALPLLIEIGDKSNQATCLNNIGEVWRKLGETRKALDFFNQSLPLLREVGDRANEAVNCFNIGMIYANEGDLDKAIEYLERTVALDIEVEHPELENDRRTLARLKAQRDGTPLPAEEAQSGIPAETIRALVNIYQTQGETALRELIKKANVPEEMTEQVIQMIQAAASAAPAPQNAASDTLPEKTILTWANNTIAVKTEVPEKCEEWLQILKGTREQISTQGEAWANELAFVDALLAILEDKPLSIAEDNPYANVVNQVQAAIEKYKNEKQS